MTMFLLISACEYLKILFGVVRKMDFMDKGMLEVGDIFPSKFR
jgi:hypothetical protein